MTGITPATGASAGGALPSTVRRALGRIANAWLPRSCALCDLPLRPHEPGVCDECVDELPGLRATRCPRCAIRVASPEPCERCRASPPAFDRTIVLADYAPPLDRLIVALKFRAELALARPLGALLAERLRAQAPEPPDAVAWVPLAPLRLASRGFDQARAIARSAARQLGIARPAALLHRERETQAQSTLPADRRADNLRDAMRASAAAGLSVLVVDDVMTSGATLQAAAQALKAAGARRVVNLVAARTP